MPQKLQHSLIEDDRRLTLRKSINIGVAMDTPDDHGDSRHQQEGIIELSHWLMIFLREEARDGSELTAGEMQGTTKSHLSAHRRHELPTFAPIVDAALAEFPSRDGGQCV